MINPHIKGYRGIKIVYLGASYYCGVSALRAGADSVHVFCDAAAASVIRAYTTELVIHPVLDQEYGMEEVNTSLRRFMPWFMTDIQRDKYYYM